MFERLRHRDTPVADYQRRNPKDGIRYGAADATPADAASAANPEQTTIPINQRATPSRSLELQAAEQLLLTSRRPGAVQNLQVTETTQAPGPTFMGMNIDPSTISPQNLTQIMTAGIGLEVVKALTAMHSAAPEAPRTIPGVASNNEAATQGANHRPETDAAPNKRPRQKSYIGRAAVGVVLVGASVAATDPMDNMPWNDSQQERSSSVAEQDLTLIPTIERPGKLESLSPEHFVATTELDLTAQTMWDLRNYDTKQAAQAAAAADPANTELQSQVFIGLEADPASVAVAGESNTGEAMSQQELFQIAVPSVEIQWLLNNVTVDGAEAAAVTTTKNEGSNITKVVIDMSRIQLRAKVDPSSYREVLEDPAAIKLFAAFEDENNQMGAAISQTFLENGVVEAPEDVLKIPEIYEKNIDDAVYQLIDAGIREVEAGKHRGQLIEKVKDEIVRSFGLNPDEHVWEFINEEAFAIGENAASPAFLADHEVRNDRVRLVTEGENPAPSVKLKDIILPEGQ